MIVVTPRVHRTNQSKSSMALDDAPPVVEPVASTRRDATDRVTDRPTDRPSVRRRPTSVRLRRRSPVKRRTLTRILRSESPRRRSVRSRDRRCVDELSIYGPFRLDYENASSRPFATNEPSGRPKSRSSMHGRTQYIRSVSSRLRKRVIPSVRHERTVGASARERTVGASRARCSFRHPRRDRTSGDVGVTIERSRLNARARANEPSA